MTVIAWRGRTMAADKQSSDVGMARTTTKIRRLKCGSIVGSSGDSATAWLLEKWYEDGADLQSFPDRERRCNMLVLTPAGQVLLFDGGPLPDIIEEEFTAIGSGREYAVGAMAFGATPEEAARISCMFDTGCGRGVDVLHLDAA